MSRITSNRLALLGAGLLLASAGVIAGCFGSDDAPLCSTGDGGPDPTITDTILHGGGVPDDPSADPSSDIASAIDGGTSAQEALVTGPRTFVGSLAAEVAIRSLTVGGVAADSKEPNYASWSVTLQPADLEANRVTGTEYARIQVVAFDVCGNSHYVDSTLLRIGADPKAGLSLSASKPEGTECYLPANGAAATTVTIVAGPDYADAVVTLAASAGTFSLPSPTLEQGSGDLVSAQSYFTYSGMAVPAVAAGTSVVVTLSASSEGSVSAPHTILVAGAPRILPNSPTPLVYGQGASLTFHADTKGRLASCYLEVSGPGTGGPGVKKTATEVCLPPYACATILGGSTSWDDSKPANGVLQATALTPPKCNDKVDDYAINPTGDTFDVQLTFEDATPSGTQATLRCVDAFGQEGSSTVIVQYDAGTGQ